MIYHLGSSRAVVGPRHEPNARHCRYGSKWLPVLKETEMPVVRVSWFAGKDAKAKKAVAAEITESIVKNTGTDAKYIYVLFEDIAPSDWAGAGKLFGEEPEKS
jgi:4-oxalocrotonate tautomerase